MAQATRAESQLTEFVEMPNLVAVLGGLHGSAFIPSLPYIHQHHLLIMAAWAATAEAIDHGLAPSYTFRVSEDPLVGSSWSPRP